jgi:hypothetical protein
MSRPISFAVVGASSGIRSPRSIGSISGRNFFLFFANRRPHRNGQSKKSQFIQFGWLPKRAILSTIKYSRLGSITVGRAAGGFH